MYKLARPVFLFCESSVHAGSGSDLGIVDLPIQRERHTGFPKIEASGLKGSLRDAVRRRERLYFQGRELSGEAREESMALVFGPETGGEYAAALGLTDARVLLFPVRSVKGVYAWVTCPQVLERFKNDLLLADVAQAWDVPATNSTPDGCSLYVGAKSGKIVLEEYTFEARPDAACSRLAGWLAEVSLPQGPSFDYLRSKMTRDLLVLSDDDFSDFVQMSTEVITRTKIDQKTGTVEKGALFTEEYLPAETVLYSLVLTAPVFNVKKGVFTDGEKAVLRFFQENLPPLVQIGGDATIGKGLVGLGDNLLEVKDHGEQSSK
ncbi:CRISPR type III-B/RAMP module RAMP protein Cmr4 [Acididesulfobacillus acetoxydans]|uniref:CRISPR system Cmr subunit Cmr4 n=1 Tax=Acididesulfobacillus acetoxydans TaxID=1561005 RepID=A0A8S0VYA5_9FIRM|nr:type III-B CRISPR module RAMP protein Cmr4 [Acididesulfobacillus acetoxydans]CAA7602813.1 CRISPR type III-B/RAMP module RAMP protein Cmr4 [Acididesulfobacillus acetoxydans]CEJ06010.1 CRISPR system Cmr subunit Cmr4 [Acididesulfobacillus acetoxydans]